LGEEKNQTFTSTTFGKQKVEPINEIHINTIYKTDGKTSEATRCQEIPYKDHTC
jgi:hypothetical protein